jgi:hypothetical protein
MGMPERFCADGETAAPGIASLELTPAVEAAETGSGRTRVRVERPIFPDVLMIGGRKKDKFV